MTTAKLTIRIPEDEHERLKSRAEEDKRSINKQVLHYIAEGMKRPTEAAKSPEKDA